MIQSIQTKHSFLLSLLTVFGLLFFSSCDDNGSGSDEPEPEVEANTVEDLNADGQYAFFSLRTGEIVDSADSASTEWDLAFNATTILTNSGISGPGSGGAIVLDASFNSVAIAPAEGYNIDEAEILAIPTGTDNGWYHYTGFEGTPPHGIIPLPDKTIVVRTADGNHYAKVQILSYYKGNPDVTSEDFNDEDNPGRHYTFEYTIQLQEGVRDLE
ncbi:HmuY family protein [Rhodohalobacter sp. 614A]|uniref:HmuY family protein n=1 Tax=Rhodohalobacter sp. 614A TaxID=2908649 RepID=UPI001F168D9F|nr:HmuY family protein [Rhodohalobacter sp. 614A]